eukprot:COSAG03_NODE_24069_length_275_cov_0.579545_1_plen_39_part_10
MAQTTHDSTNDSSRRAVLPVQPRPVAGSQLQQPGNAAMV